MRKFFTGFAGMGLLMVVLNIILWGIIISGIWWAWNHVVSPSFDVPQLQVK